MDDEKKQTLYTHLRHPHQPRDINQAHKEAQQGFNARLAMFITRHVGTMWCAYIFFGIGIGSLVGILTNNVPLALVCGSVSSYVIQLVLLPVIMVGQNLSARHSELLAEEQFNTTQKTYHDIEQVMGHLDSQDGKILAIEQQILLVLKSLEQSRSRIVRTSARKVQRESITQDARAVLVPQDKSA